MLPIGNDFNKLCPYQRYYSFTQTTLDYSDVLNKSKIRVHIKLQETFEAGRANLKIKQQAPKTNKLRVVRLSS